MEHKNYPIKQREIVSHVLEERALQLAMEKEVRKHHRKPKDVGRQGNVTGSILGLPQDLLVPRRTEISNCSTE